MSNYNGMVKLQDASESLKKLLKIQNEIVDELWVVPVSTFDDKYCGIVC
tara:strand:+ start:4029 stop:4175 length:147 start_codon:yes stop_codon:yes gene_type:complete